MLKPTSELQSPPWWSECGPEHHLRRPAATTRWSRLRGGLLLVCLALLPVGCSTRIADAPLPPAQAAALDHLLNVMRLRLLLMHDVARSKWNAGKPIADPAREQVVLDQVVSNGRRHALDPALVRRFFAAQMEAGKLIQYANFEQWQAQGQEPFPGTPDLDVLRGRLDELNDSLLDALAEVADQRDEEPFQRSIAARARVLLVGPGLEEMIIQKAIRPLEE